MTFVPGRLFGRSARPAWRKLALAAAAGGVVAIGQAPWSLWWAALPALGLVTALIGREGRPARAIWLGWIAGAGYFAASLFWIVEPFFIDVARHGWMAPFALFFMAFGMALFWALAAGIAALGTGGTARAAGFALGLAATDLLRGYVFTGFPWALIGHVWIGTPVMQGRGCRWAGRVDGADNLRGRVASLRTGPRRTPCSRRPLSGGSCRHLGRWCREAGRAGAGARGSDPRPHDPAQRRPAPEMAWRYVAGFLRSPDGADRRACAGTARPRRLAGNRRALSPQPQ